MDLGKTGGSFFQVAEKNNYCRLLGSGQVSSECNVLSVKVRSILSVGCVLRPGWLLPHFQTLRRGAPDALAPTSGTPLARSWEFWPHAATCQEQGPAPPAPRHAPHTWLSEALPAAPPPGDLRKSSLPLEEPRPRTAGPAPAIRAPGLPRPADRFRGAGAGPCAMT